jgi:hypothetical protein
MLTVIFHEQPSPANRNHVVIGELSCPEAGAVDNNVGTISIPQPRGRSGERCIDSFMDNRATVAEHLAQ